MRDPLLHFLAFGLLVFAVDAWWSGPEDTGDSTIVVTDALVEDLSRQLQSTYERPPSADEVQAAVDAWITEEILVREATLRGLDRADPIVRNRLAEKMAFVAEAQQVPDEPDEEALRALYEAHADDYTHPTRLTLRQVFAPDPETAEALAARWAAGEDPRELGEDPPGGPVLRGRTPERLTELYGPEFAEVVQGMEIGTRTVVASPSGWHVVELEKRQDGGTLSFDEARLRLRARWQRERVDDATMRAVEALGERYIVEGWPR